MFHASLEAARVDIAALVRIAAHTMLQKERERDVCRQQGNSIHDPNEAVGPVLYATYLLVAHEVSLIHVAIVISEHAEALLVSRGGIHLALVPVGALLHQR